MIIKIIESYDSELGYDEEKYYEINNYKNMVVYAQKNKHKQGLEGITLDFDSLIEDLKKKKILIKSEFEDIKEGDLDKYGDYYILPDDFVNDVITQLGYEPTKKRTYKDNKVKYHDDIISDIEFEQIIADKNHDLHWLSKARFKDAEIVIGQGMSVDDILFSMSGTWISGTWQEGEFFDGIWRGGIWEYGEFTNSIWEKGTWEDGCFKDSKWESGFWEKGSFYHSIWENGVWQDGKFYESIWDRGVWHDGILGVHPKTKFLNINTFKPENIQYELYSHIYSFEEIWNNSELLLKIKQDWLHKKNDDIHIGNHLLTKKQIEQRIKEIS